MKTLIEWFENLPEWQRLFVIILTAPWGLLFLLLATPTEVDG